MDVETLEIKLRESYHLIQELENVFEHISEGIYITDGNGIAIRVNKAFEEITGLKSEDVIGIHVQQLIDDGIVNRSVTLKVLKSKKTETILHQLGSGNLQSLTTGIPVFDESGNIIRVLSVIKNIAELEKLKKQLKSTIVEKLKYQKELNKALRLKSASDGIVVCSNAWKKVVDLAQRMGGVSSTVLITGESGVGKDVVAQIIHDVDDDETRPLIKVNCGAIPDNLLESELFGFEKGAFSGAVQRKQGLIELADGGTLFLDEIGELPLNLQVKILRVIQDKVISRLGSIKEVEVNVRIVAATNRDLKAMIQDGAFREDLFYRLFVVPIHIPPLRERSESIIPLTLHFLQKYNRQFKKTKKIASETLKHLENYSWPGNIRELENAVERLVLITDTNIIESVDLSDHIRGKGMEKRDEGLKDKRPLREILAEIEIGYIKEALKNHPSTYKASKALGISRTSLRGKIKKYRL